MALNKPNLKVWCSFARDFFYWKSLTSSTCYVCVRKTRKTAKRLMNLSLTFFDDFFEHSMLEWIHIHSLRISWFPLNILFTIRECFSSRFESIFNPIFLFRNEKNSVLKRIFNTKENRFVCVKRERFFWFSK